METIGIWMDKKKAHIITTGVEGEQLTTIYSEIEDYHIGGGSGTRLKGGPQDVVQDSKYLEREKHQRKGYFKEILSQITKANKIVIFGPAETGEQFYKELNENHKQISQKVDKVITADSMTENQMKALVRDYYNPKIEH